MPRSNPSVKIGRRGTAHWTHGRDNAYKAGCRCEECRYAHRLAFPCKNPDAPEEMCPICGRWYQAVGKHDWVHEKDRQTADRCRTVAGQSVA